ncbi:MAG TPA: helix-turn-helix domain-containing protein [Emcibacteraceae bacterium]|nr:helix-turn-helix domain-containing protein [Emcibacteraceae bacterium]HRW28525.1 helix-turn-helix domain-containing protein [Emcibacteraceae bacterium]
MMTKKIRSNCPVSYALELIGDKWSLLILRDIILRDKRFYHEFAASAEGIATNILSNRLAMLESNGFINKQRDTEDRKRYIYSPTEKGLDLLPVIISMMQWSDKYNNETDIRPPLMEKVRKDPKGYEKSIRAKFSA